MPRETKTIQDAAQLLQLTQLISATALDIINEWSGEGTEKSLANGSGGSSDLLPSQSLYDAQQKMLAAAGKLTELVAEPSSRIIELGCQYWESRALLVAADKRIPDLLARAGDRGMTAEEIGKATGIEHLKLSRTLRCLCSQHVFKQVGEDSYANNSISAALVNNEPLRAYVMLFGLDLYSAADHWPKWLANPEKNTSYDVTKTAFQDAVGTDKARWDWLEEKVSVKDLNTSKPGYPGPPSRVEGKDDTLVTRPEHAVFGLAMVGGGRTFGAAHVLDYPWASLGEATIVDVGGGAGGFSMQLSQLYPQLKFVVQDRGPVLEQAKTEVWPQDNPRALKEGRVSFVEHDFFKPNPVKGADVYWLRYIFHDWSDSYCHQILLGLRSAVAPHSRILICDQVMNTTNGSAELPSAPAPLPANYGYAARYSHQRDLAMMGIINGIERTPAQWKALVEKAGFQLKKIYPCRSQVGLIEVGL